MAETTLIQYGHFTHKGTHRQENQDAVLCAPQHGFWAVADGMGGHAKGEFASQEIIGFLAEVAPKIPGAEQPIDLFYDALAQANRNILDHASTLGPHQIVGSTAALLFFQDDHYHVLWAGDSRCYLLRDNQFQQLTQDHADPQAPNVLTNAIGVNPELVIDYHKGVLYEDDCFLLCSDGLYKVYSDAQLQHALTSKHPPQVQCQNLLDTALEQGANDNISAVIIKVSVD